MLEDSDDLREKITIWRTVHGLPDEEIAKRLCCPVFQVTAYAQQYEIRRRKGPAIPILKQQMDELKYRLTKTGEDHVSVLQEVNAFLRKQGYDVSDKTPLRKTSLPTPKDLLQEALNAWGQILEGEEIGDHTAVVNWLVDWLPKVKELLG